MTETERAKSAEKADNREETYKHIMEVQRQLEILACHLRARGVRHDQSKLESPEVEIFDEYTPKLKGCTYGSEEYKRYLREMNVALKHHYAHNRHHPEHYKEGVAGMNLVDLVEMFCDWAAAVKRHSDGDLLDSIGVNTQRFGLSDQLRSILANTIELMGD